MWDKNVEIPDSNQKWKDAAADAEPGDSMGGLTQEDARRLQTALRAKGLGAKMAGDPNVPSAGDGQPGAFRVWATVKVQRKARATKKSGNGGGKAKAKKGAE